MQGTDKMSISYYSSIYILYISVLSLVAGGRIFPGEHHLADFAVTDEDSHISMSIRSRDGQMAVQLRARESDSLPESSCFESLADSSASMSASPPSRTLRGK